MKISAQDEYGLRILLQIARAEGEEGVSIPQLSEAEGLTASYVAKITRALRLAELVESTRGHKGGYILARPANQIKIKDALRSLGGALFDEDFCSSHSGGLKICTNSVDCSVRSLWRMIQLTVDELLEKITLQDLIGSEKDATNALHQLLESKN